jgi:hypothetical protein
MGRFHNRRFCRNATISSSCLLGHFQKSHFPKKRWIRIDRLFRVGGREKSIIGSGGRILTVPPGFVKASYTEIVGNFDGA